VKGFCLEVSGPFACFTRPEMKVERVSYDVITPSAARGIFEAILWKPAIRWRITKIEVMAPIRWVSIRRNEVNRIASNGASPILIEDDRVQRASLILRDVRYRLTAEFELLTPCSASSNPNVQPEQRQGSEHYDGHRLTPLKDQDEDFSIAAIGSETERSAKYSAMFERRATKGQCFQTPYLGTREFACSFALVKTDHMTSPIDESRDLGWMLYDMDYADRNCVRPMFFKAEMVKGVISIPHPESEEVKR